MTGKELGEPFDNDRKQLQELVPARGATLLGSESVESIRPNGLHF